MSSLSELSLAVAVAHLHCVGDSMGGGPTGLRVGLLDYKRVMEQRKRRIVVGIVAVGTSSEIEREGRFNMFCCFLLNMN